MLFVNYLAFLIGTGAGTGFMPKAPGTAGALLGALLFYFFMGSLSISVQLGIVFIVTLPALWSAAQIKKVSGKSDDQRIVIDEILGVWITLIGAPVSISWVFVGFILFRIFDIAKPFPVNWIDQKWPGARGVIFDDVMAGVYGYVVLQLLIRLGVFF